MTKVNEIDRIDEVKPANHEPIFNMPLIIIVFCLLIIAVHFVRYFFLSSEQDNLLLYLLAFIPASYGPLADSAPFPMSGWWSPVTHGLLHGDWMHVTMNLIWMAAFGSPVAKRFGLWRFVLLTIICSCGGALLHYFTAENPFVPIIGASGAVSGYMGAASRFVFHNMSSGMRFREDGDAMTLLQSFQNKQFLIFFTLWMGLNYVFGAGFVDIAGDGALIAWQAHIGGFLAGLLVFSVLDPLKRS